ncbi:MAG: hypothetical protein WCW46_01085 [Candidatus Paceibacterota bacterium]
MRRKKSPPGFNIHHRKPRRFGGQTTEENISVVRRVEHKAWNILFDNLPAHDVVRLFREYWEIFGNESRVTHEIRQIGLSVLGEMENFQKYKDLLSEAELNRIKRTLSTERSKLRKSRAWGVLFSGLSLEQILVKINGVWIDPDYKLVAEVTQATNVKLEARF